MVIVIPHEWILYSQAIAMFTVLYGICGFFVYLTLKFNKEDGILILTFLGASIMFFLIPTIALMMIKGLIIIK